MNRLGLFERWFPKHVKVRNPEKQSAICKYTNSHSQANDISVLAGYQYVITFSISCWHRVKRTVSFYFQSMGLIHRMQYSIIPIQYMSKYSKTNCNITGEKFILWNVYFDINWFLPKYQPSSLNKLIFKRNILSLIKLIIFSSSVHVTFNGFI